MRNAPANGGARNDVGDQTNVSIMPPLPSEVNSVEFLEWFRPGGPWVLSAIVPDGRITTLTFDQQHVDQMRAWITSRDGAENLYFQVNSSGDKRLNSKASKDDIVAAEWLHVDIDGDKAAILPRLEAFRLRPSAVVDSGGGYQAFWRIAATDELADVEAINRWLAAELGGDHCHNRDRIMRLPGTMNLPNKKKAKAGRVPVRGKLVWAENTVHVRTAFGRVAEESCGTSTRIVVGEWSGPTDTLFLAEALPPWAFRMLRDARDSKGEPFGSRSEHVWAFVGACVRDGVPHELTKWCLLNPDFLVSEHILSQSNVDRAVERTIERMEARNG